MPTKNPTLHGSAPDQSSVALLLVDVINDFNFPEADLMLPRAIAAAAQISSLRQHAQRENVPVIYVNDNFGRWRSDFNATVENALKSKGRAVAERLRPGPDDYFVLKPKHSGFFSTTLEILLHYLGVRSVVIAGFAGNICVLFTAADAHMRDLDLSIPADATASNTVEENQAALALMASVFKADTRPAAEVSFAALARLRELRHANAGG